ncbi:alkaline phosphatase family protein [Dyadobacter sp. CY312]|uniref:alkaline phosphatase family protein n=1 Tax=Dyadobacter sp. CY312 TaxID=2907303 RepID=UPI001F372BFE|nr:alkaline phosphatase family protein [Dyadobacter sp. CY312]MCE7042004.1 alkaline phosphatase family protein [Dyadobacter sp. CY312]
MTCLKPKFLYLFFICLLTVEVLAQSDKKKALFVIVDGISAEQLRKVATPSLDAISKAGGFTKAYVGGEKKTYSQTPTISAVGYNSLLTGTWVNKHNVWDNDIKDPNYHYWTIFRFFQEAYPAKRTAVFSTWLDNRTKLIGTGLAQTNKLQMHYSFDGFELDTLNFPHDKEAGYIHKIDEKVVDEAARYISDEAPDLSWVYLEYTDDMGHKYGNSEQFNKAIGYMDVQMGRLWKAIQYREKNFGEDWQIFITTDHGRGEPEGQNHGGQSDGERSTWIVTNAKGLNSYFQGKAGSGSVPGIVDIMPTIARHLQIPIKHEQKLELDGAALTGKLSVLWPTAKKNNDKIAISWKSVEKDGSVKIWLSTTNKFEEGGSDRYLLMKEVPVTNENAVLDIAKLPKGFYKIVIEGKYNTVNKWIVE